MGYMEWGRGLQGVWITLRRLQSGVQEQRGKAAGHKGA